MGLLRLGLVSECRITKNTTIGKVSNNKKKSRETGDGNRCTALFCTVTLGCTECTVMLLSCGVLTDTQERKGRTPRTAGPPRVSWTP